MEEGTLSNVKLFLFLPTDIDKGVLSLQSAKQIPPSCTVGPINLITNLNRKEIETQFKGRFPSEEFMRGTRVPPSVGCQESFCDTSSEGTTHFPTLLTLELENWRAISLLARLLLLRTIVGQSGREAVNSPEKHITLHRPPLPPLGAPPSPERPEELLPNILPIPFDKLNGGTGLEGHLHTKAEFHGNYYTSWWAISTTIHPAPPAANRPSTPLGCTLATRQIDRKRSRLMILESSSKCVV